MKAKIDLEKFISSMLGYAEDNCEKTMLDYLHSALQDQGLEYKDGEIVKIEQEQPYNKPLFFEKGKWYTCIAKVDGFKVGHTYQSKMDGTVSNDSGAMYMYHNDVNLIFRPATEVEVKKGGKLCMWGDFVKTHEGTVIIIPKDLKGTDTDGGVVGEKGEQGEQPELKMPETPKGNYGSDFDIDKYRSLTHQLDYIIDSLRNLRYKMYIWELIDTKK